MNGLQELTIEPAEYVHQQGGAVKTSSRTIAEKFQKDHKNVISKIRLLQSKFNGPTFEPVVYTDKKGELRTEYEMSRKGFMLLAMRFTGDAAFEVQEKFVDAFEMMEKHITEQGKGQLSKRAELIPTAEPVFQSLYNVAGVFGLESNQARLFANKATRRETGIDFQDILQIEMKAPTQDRYFTPTELGQRLGLSAIKFNRNLSELGFQEKKNDVWCATEKGKPFSVLLDAGKKHSDGTPIQQLKWMEAILQHIRADA